MHLSSSVYYSKINKATNTLVSSFNRHLSSSNNSFRSPSNLEKMRAIKNNTFLFWQRFKIRKFLFLLKKSDFHVSIFENVATWRGWFHATFRNFLLICFEIL